VCVCVSVCLCVCEREREREDVSVCFCMFVCEREPYLEPYCELLFRVERISNYYFSFDLYLASHMYQIQRQTKAQSETSSRAQFHQHIQGKLLRP